MNLKKVCFMLSLIFITSLALYSSPTIDGTTGTVTMPTTSTIGRGGLELGFHYLGGYPTSVVLLGYGISEAWDLTGAFESDSNDPISPFFHVDTKYRYYEGNINSAIGCNIQHANSSSNATRFSIYDVIGATALYGEFSLGIGYTFDNSDNINFWMGYSYEIFKNVLFFETDFANFPYRYPWAKDWLFANTDRGIVNMALRLHIAKVLTFNLGSLDIMDSNRKVFLGGDFKFNI